MQVTADTSTVVSGLLWHGPPRQVLDEARAGNVTLFTSPPLLAELEDVLNRGKFAERLQRAGVSVRDLVVGYAALATVVKPEVINAVVKNDPDDDQVLACAVVAQAEVIVSGDKHLLGLGNYRGIPILSAVDLLARLAAP